MEALLPFLEKYETWIYVLLGVVALVYLQKTFSAWQQWQGTLFGLEREIAQRRFTTVLTILILLVLFVVVEFVIVSFVSPSYPQVAYLPTPTLDVLATPTVTLPAVVDAAKADTTENTTFGIATQPVLEGCIPGQIEWDFPKTGESISATVELKGTVNVPNLGYYKYEYSRPGEEENWTQVAAGNQPKVNGQIGFWNTSQLDPGDYLLRLVVLDNQNNVFPACKIAVRIVRQ